MATAASTKTKPIETDLTQLRRENAALKQELEKQAYDMGERVKELTCSLSVARATESEKSVKDVFEEATQHLIDGFQYPEITVAVVTMDGVEYSCVPEENRGDLSWCLQSTLEVKDQGRGFVRVYYREEKPWLIPFEQNLLDNVTFTLSTFVERLDSELALQKHAEELENAVKRSERGRAWKL